MKKIITSAGLVALGAAGVQAAYAPGLTPLQTAKPWSVSATLRGFYDDNYTTSPEDTARDSYGFEISPSAAVNITRDQTYLGASYVYSMRYFDDRDDHKADHSHQANAKLSHAFTERYKIDVADSFVVAQEPEVIDPDIKTAFLRTSGDNIRNTGVATFTADLSDRFSAVLGYSNTFYDYEQTGPASRSAVLDRMEHMITANGRWQALPSTVGVLGYQYGRVDYTSNNNLVDPAFGYVDPESRNNESHYAYVGIDQTITPTLNASVRLGAQYTQYNTDKVDSTVSPYADANATWTYMKESYVQLGVRQSRSQTDLAFAVAPVTAEPTVDAESTLVYGSVNHKILAQLTASLLGQYQYSRYEGGFADGNVDNFFLIGLNLTYDINRFLAAEVGYNYDRLDSDLDVRSYTRNRVYVGIRATY